MKKMIFASDLDNTLLFSCKHRQEGDLCVERLEAKEQGFMTPGTVALLERVVQMVPLIPVTTRSMQQYLRIQFPACVSPAYAVVANGAILLHNGQKDERWEAETLDMIGSWLTELDRMEAVIPNRLQGRRLRRVDGAYLFLSCTDPEDAAYCRAELTDTTLEVRTTGRKLYLFPPPINKGAAIMRLRQRFDSPAVISAGDSEIDIPMLRASDLAIVPKASMLEGDARNCGAVWDGTGRFSEYVLQRLLAWMQDGE